jgi:hypothetical protein
MVDRPGIGDDGGVADEVQSAMEMVGVVPKKIEFPGADGTLSEGTIHVLAEGGYVLVHAVTDMQVGQSPEASCRKANRRLAPTFWDWDRPHPEHLIRCPDCLAIYPLDEIS